MKYVECENCGSAIRCDFKDCPYCDFRFSKGRFWDTLAALTGNAMLKQTGKNASLPVHLD
jgi:hypothetical protein